MCRIFLRSRRPQREIESLLGSENIVPQQISPEPDYRDDEECDEADVVVYYPGKRKNYRYPPDDIVTYHDKVERVSKAPFNGGIAAGFFLFPCEPHVGMSFHDYSVNHPDDHEGDEFRKG